jgi:hypothetical protein
MMSFRPNRATVVIVSVAGGLAVSGGIAYGELTVAPPPAQPDIQVAPAQPQPELQVESAPPQPEVQVAQPEPQPELHVEPAPAPTPTPQPQPQQAPSPQPGAASPQPDQAPTPQPTPTPAPQEQPPLQGAPADAVQGQSEAPIQGGSTDTGAQLQGGSTDTGAQLQGGPATDVQPAPGGAPATPATPGAATPAATGTSTPPAQTQGDSIPLKAGEALSDGGSATRDGYAGNAKRTSHVWRDSSSAARRSEAAGVIGKAGRLSQGAKVIGGVADPAGAVLDYKDQRQNHSATDSAGHATAEFIGGKTLGTELAALCTPESFGTLTVACFGAGNWVGGKIGGGVYSAARWLKEKAPKRHGSAPAHDAPTRETATFILPL